ncbi:MAG: hypothetical protein VW683_08895 [Betaproteobacteria bacterium]
MGTGYVRNDTANNIADGNIINASDLDGEFDAVQSAFNASTGHTHDGTTGEGAPIEVIGPTQDVVATASVLRPKTDNTIDLGTTTLEYKDLFLDGTAHIDTLDVDENASITGTLGVTGATTLSSTLGVTGAATLSSTLGVTGATTLSSTLGVTGAATLSSTLAVTGATGIDGDFDINTNKFTVASATGNTVVAGTLGVTGATTATGGLNVDTISEITSANGVVIDGVTLKDGGATVTADVSFGDNDKAIFGAGSDLQIYHDGSNSYISDQGTGNLKILGAGIVLKDDSDTNSFVNCIAATGQVELRYGGSTKLATTATGVDVTGTVTADGLTVDANLATIGAGGATNQATELRLDGTSNAANGAYIRGQRGGSNAFLIGDTAGALGSGTGVINYVYGSNPWSVYTNANERLTVANNGDISFYEDTGTTPKFFWDASAESLGIGTTSPATPLHVNADASAVGILITSGNTGNAEIIFGDQEDSSRGDIRYENSTDSMRFSTNNKSEAMRIDSSGNLLVGTTTTDTTAAAGFTVQSDGQLFSSADSQHVATMTRLTDDGDILTFRRSAIGGAGLTTVGSIGSYSDKIYIGNGDTGLRFVNTSNQIRPFNTSTLADRDAGFSLGSSGARFTDLYLSGGVYLGGTGSANKLDDYEEGTWTPSDGSSAGLTFSNVVANYTKIGRQVFIQCELQYPSTADVTDMDISGLPFAARDTYRFAGVMSYTTSALAGSAQIINGTTTSIRFRQNGGSTVLHNNELSGIVCRFTMVYHTNS